MTTEIITSLIAATTVVLGALVTLAIGYWQWVKKPADDRLAAKEQADQEAHDEQMRHLTTLVQQIKNSHDKNLRDDLDDKVDRLEKAIEHSAAVTDARIETLSKRVDRLYEGR